MRKSPYVCGVLFTAAMVAVTAGTAPNVLAFTEGCMRHTTEVDRWSFDDVWHGGDENAPPMFHEDCDGMGQACEWSGEYYDLGPYTTAHASWTEGTISSGSHYWDENGPECQGDPL